eukprot:tig00020961_g16756.t1
MPCQESVLQARPRSFAPGLAPAPTARSGVDEEEEIGAESHLPLYDQPVAAAAADALRMQADITRDGFLAREPRSGRMPRLKSIKPLSG